MRRRVPDGAVPAVLAVFTLSDWPRASWRDKFELWRTARNAYREAHGWPGGPLEQLRGESDIRAVYGDHKLHSWGRTRVEMEAAAEELARLYGRRPMLLPQRDDRGPAKPTAPEARDSIQ